MEQAVLPGAGQGSRHVSSLDGLRGIAILLVLAVHLVLAGVVPEQPSAALALRKLMWCGWSGVDLFFVLSGFLITGILLDSRESENYFRVFYMRRVLRIFPLYYFAILACVVLLPLLALRFAGLWALYPRPAGWLSYLFYYQNWWMPLREPTHGILGHFWSLGVEEQFYLVWPACVLLLPTKRLPWMCLVGAVAAMVLRFTLARPGPASEFILECTATRFDSLLIGGFVAFAVRRAGLFERARKVSAVVFVASFAVIAAINLIGHETLSRGYYTQTLGFTFYALAYACVVLWAFAQNGTGTWLDRALNQRGLRMFGRYSYGIYVYHGPIYFALASLLNRYPWYGRSVGMGLLASFAFVGTSLGVAVLSFRYLESPFLRMKRFFKVRSARGPLRRERLVV